MHVDVWNATRIGELCDAACSANLYHALTSLPVRVMIPPSVYIPSILHIVACVLGPHPSAARFGAWMAGIVSAMNLTTPLHGDRYTARLTFHIQFTPKGAVAFSTGSYVQLNRLMPHRSYTWQVTTAVVALVLCANAAAMLFACRGQRTRARIRAKVVACTICMSFMLLSSYAFVNMTHRVDLSRATLHFHGRAVAYVDARLTERGEVPLVVFGNASFVPLDDLYITLRSTALQEVFARTPYWHLRSVQTLKRTAEKAMAIALDDLNAYISRWHGA